VLTVIHVLKGNQEKGTCAFLRVNRIFLLFFFLLSSSLLCPAQPAPEAELLLRDGAWCWFSDPRAVYHHGEHERTYTGWVDSRGNINVGYFDHRLGNFHARTLDPQLEVDDHNNPSLLLTPDGRLLVFYSRHSRSDPIFLQEARRPESIAEWAPRRALSLNDTAAYRGLLNSYTYTNPALLSEEGDRIYLFWRGMDLKPNVAHSDDLGKTWSKGKILIQPPAIYKNRRPYLKVAGDGRDRIHLAFTDGHPRKEPTNSIYYAQYREGAFYRADGQGITTYDELPFEPRQADLVYDASETGERAWIWDVAADREGRPVLVYARFPDDGHHVYYYARWDGRRWRNYRLLDSGGWFPKTPPGEEEREPNYSGGLVLDHEDPNIVYLSRERGGVFEIERWTTTDGGQSWNKARLTQNSGRDNVRPFAVRGAEAGTSLQVLWMRLTRYGHYTDFKGDIFGGE